MNPLDIAIEPPAPPDGYSFVAYHGEMAKDRIRNRSTDATPSRAVQLEWLSAPGGIGAIVDQAVSAGRSWSFGWIRFAQERPLRYPIRAGAMRWQDALQTCPTLPSLIIVRRP